jgi:N-acyl-D-amino-acid deacylase
VRRELSGERFTTQGVSAVNLRPVLALAASVLLLSCTAMPELPALPGQAAKGAPFDIVIRNGLIHDGTGGTPYRGEVAIRGDRIVAMGAKVNGPRLTEIDARGQAVAPGFINMLSWATDSLIADGRGLSDLKQGVTLEVMGEGSSMGPWNPEMKRLERQRQGDIRYDIAWTTLGEYLAYLEKEGISPNVASFVGAETVRTNVLGEGDEQPGEAQLQRMRALVVQAMEEGALGVGSSLIYAPGSYAETRELTALATEAGRCGGIYISHMRSEGNRLLEAIDELIDISRKSGAPAEIWHLKAAGRQNWGKLDAAIARIEAARASGLRITANMYTYTAGSTGLDAAMPPWVQAGGREAWIKRLKDPQIRREVIAEMRTDSPVSRTSTASPGPRGRCWSASRTRS